MVRCNGVECRLDRVGDVLVGGRGICQVLHNTLCSLDLQLNAVSLVIYERLVIPVSVAMVVTVSQGGGCVVGRLDDGSDDC